MAVGTTMGRCSENIGLHNTLFAGTTVLQYFENTELRSSDPSRTEQDAWWE
jgi:hypothetical protein